MKCTFGKQLNLFFIPSDKWRDWVVSVITCNIKMNQKDRQTDKYKDLHSLSSCRWWRVAGMRRVLGGGASCGAAIWSHRQHWRGNTRLDSLQKAINKRRYCSPPPPPFVPHSHILLPPHLPASFFFSLLFSVFSCLHSFLAVVIALAFYTSPRIFVMSSSSQHEWIYRDVEIYVLPSTYCLFVCPVQDITIVNNNNNFLIIIILLS